MTYSCFVSRRAARASRASPLPYARLQSQQLTKTKILWVEFPGELPVGWGISPLRREILMESLTCKYAGS